jgi:hypothetical protein
MMRLSAALIDPDGPAFAAYYHVNCLHKVMGEEEANRRLQEYCLSKPDDESEHVIDTLNAECGE